MKGNDTTTTARKKHLLESLTPAFGARRVGIFHEASSGDSGIDLTNLNMPSTYTNKGYANPSDQNIALLRLSYFKTNVKIISSDRGTLTLGEYDIASNTQINFDGFTANASEIFEIWYEPSVIGGATVVDARPLVKSYLLTEGNTDVVVEPFEINKNPLEQIGAVMVFRGPTMNLQFRNSGNATASALADGNYEEVKGTGGLTNIIRFNVPAAVGGESVVVVSIGSLTERPTQSLISYMENMNGDVDKLRDTVAALSGQPKSNFNGQPQSVDLASFGERFNQILNTEIEVYQTYSWTTFVPTGSWTTNVTYTGKHKRLGENVNIAYRVYCNGVPGPAATDLTLNGISGITQDTFIGSSGRVISSALLDATAGRMDIMWADVVSGVVSPYAIRPNTTDNHIGVGLNSTSGLPFAFAVNDYLEITVSYPVVGWTDYETKTLKELAGI